MEMRKEAGAVGRISAGGDLFESQTNRSGFRDTRDEWRFLLPADLDDLRQSGDKDLRHFCPREVSGRKIELAYVISANRSFFQLIKSDALVFRKQNPALLADERQPHGVFRTRLKVLQVPFVLDPTLNERLQDRLAVVKILVEIKNEVFRQR
jgi:hypothetical protein